MNRADRMYAVLKDGRWHSHADFNAAVPPEKWYLKNNASSELRKRGYVIDEQVIDGQHCYRLRGRLNEPDGAAQARGDLMSSAGTAGTPSSDGSPLGSRSLHVSGSLSLFDLPRGAYEEVA